MQLPVALLVTQSLTPRFTPRFTHSLLHRPTLAKASDILQHSFSTRRASNSALAIPPHHTSAPTTSRIDGWLPIIGLELHVQIASATKLFSRPEFVAQSVDTRTPDPNKSLAFFDAAAPGSQPTLSLDCLRLGLLASIALNCKVSSTVHFDRKHYFYSDNPNGYQITQHYAPLAASGYVTLAQEDGIPNPIEVGIKQVQLEQDTAKSLQEALPSSSLVDLNRAGCALIEIVTDPDVKSAEEAVALVKRLQNLLRHIGVSDGSMEDGSLRCDINVSVQHKDKLCGSKRCEIKNVNGLRNIQNAIGFELRRHIALLSDSKEVNSETRGYDALQRQTYHLRNKEQAPDYRYMPDPDVPPLQIPQAFVESLTATVPLDPAKVIAKLVREHSIRDQEARIVVGLLEDCKELSYMNTGVNYLESAISSAQHASPQTIASWMVQELLGSLSKAGVHFLDSPLQSSNLSLIVDAVETKHITRSSARQILQAAVKCQSPTEASLMVDESIGRARSSVEEYTLSPRDLADDLIKSMPNEVEIIKSGKHRAIMAMIGEGMKRSRGRIDASALRRELFTLLNLDHV